MGKTKNYKLPWGEKLVIFFNDLNQTWVASRVVGPLRYKICEEPTEEGLYEKLKDFHGTKDIVAPAYLRNMFEKYIDRTYPLDTAKAAILEFEDLENRGKIAKDIFGFAVSMSRIFENPYLEDFYYPYGVEVSIDQITDYLNNFKNETE